MFLETNMDLVVNGNNQNKWIYEVEIKFVINKCILFYCCVFGNKYGFWYLLERIGINVFMELNLHLCQ
jgi:hypothetical protein